MTAEYLDGVRDAISEYDQHLFFGALLLGTIYLLIETLSYSRDARLVPLLIVSTLIALLALRMSLLLLSSADVDVQEILPNPLATAIEDEGESLYDELGQEGEEEPPGLVTQLRGVAWVAIFTGTLYLFGIVYPLPILLFLFIFIEHDTSLLRTLAIVTIFSLFIYVTFVEMLNVRLYYGVFDVSFGALL